MGEGLVNVVYEDEFLCVCEKNAGVVVNEAESVKSTTVQSWFRDRIETVEIGADKEEVMEFVSKGGIVHRLDKDTSGLMVLAKNLSTYIKLKEQFVNRRIEKKYLALVHGVFAPSEGVISLPVERHSKNKHKFAVGTDYARTAVTEYSQINTFVNQEGERFGLMSLRLHTGRTHQIRVHMQHFQHPIVSDPIYGGKKYKLDVKWCPRLFLHAAALGFVHPDGEKMEFNSKLPSDLQDVIENLTAVS